MTFKPTDIELNTELLMRASQNGDVDEVKRLIPVSNPKSYNSDPLRSAAYKGYLEIVQLLIPVSDPTANDNSALFWAARNEHTECVKLLIPVSDYQMLLQDKSRRVYNTLLQQCVDEYEALQQKERLLNQLEDNFQIKQKSAKNKI